MKPTVKQIGAMLNREFDTYLAGQNTGKAIRQAVNIHREVPVITAFLDGPELGLELGILEHHGHDAAKVIAYYKHGHKGWALVDGTPPQWVTEIVEQYKGEVA